MSAGPDIDRRRRRPCRPRPFRSVGLGYDGHGRGGAEWGVRREPPCAYLYARARTAARAQSAMSSGSLRYRIGDLLPHRYQPINACACCNSTLTRYHATPHRLHYPLAHAPYVFFFVRCLRNRGPPSGQAPWEVQNFPPREGGGLIPVANRRGAVDAKIDVGRNKELRLLTPASRRWVRRLNNPFCALPVPLQLCGVCPSKEPFASRHPRMPC